MATARITHNKSRFGIEFHVAIGDLELQQIVQHGQRSNMALKNCGEYFEERNALHSEFHDHFIVLHNYKLKNNLY
jgi:hypothetical protein